MIYIALTSSKCAHYMRSTSDGATPIEAFWQKCYFVICLKIVLITHLYYDLTDFRSWFYRQIFFPLSLIACVYGANAHIFNSTIYHHRTKTNRTLNTNILPNIISFHVTGNRLWNDKYDALTSWKCTYAIWKKLHYGSDGATAIEAFWQKCYLIMSENHLIIANLC
jgi:hypothetical protein